MKMIDLAHASIHQLSLLDIRISSFSKPKNHQYVMKPAPIERFIYLTKGSGDFFVNSQRLSAKEKDMLYLPEETAYRSLWTQNSEYMVIDLLLHDVDSRPIRFGDTPRLLFNDSHGTYRGLLEELAEKEESNGPFDWLERLSLSFRLLCEIARDTKGSNPSENEQRIQTALSYLQNNFTEQFSVDVLAKMCCLSTGRFRRIFADCVGMTPVEYRNKLRIQKAVSLLKTGSVTVSEAAVASGVNDMKYFSKLFKREIGISPGAFRKLQG